MKKEKKVRAYQRRTKSGKTVTVRAHTASYEAAEKAKEAAKKKGAGDEIAERKKKNWELPMDEFLKKLKEERAQKREDEESKNVEDEKPKKKSEKKTEKKTPSKKAAKKRTVGTGTNGPEPKKKTTTKKATAKADTSEPAFTRDEFKEWYRGTGSAADKKVAKALRKQLGRSGYRKFEDEAIDNYTSRGHLSMFKRVSGGSSTGGARTTQKGKVSKPTLSKSMSENRSNASTQMKEYKKQLMSAIKDGNSKKIREARKGYLQAMDDSTFGGSKASKASAEKDYQSVVKALSKAGYDEQGYKKRSTSAKTKSSLGTKKETSSDLRARADKMDADAKRAAIVKKLGTNKFRTIKDININVVKPNTRSAQLKGTLYVSSDRTKAYYEGSDGKLKKATKSILDRYVNKASKETSKTSTSPKKRSVGTGTNGPEPKKTSKASSTTSTTGAGADWSRATVDKIGREYGGGYTIVGTPNDRLWGSTNFRTKSQALDFIKRKQKESSAKGKKSSKESSATKKSPTLKKEPISEQSLNSKGFKTFKMPQIGTLYLGKKGKGAYIKFKGKKTIQKADIDDYGDFITGHNGLTKSQKKQLSSLGYTEHEEY